MVFTFYLLAIYMQDRKYNIPQLTIYLNSPLVEHYALRHNYRKKSDLICYHSRFGQLTTQSHSFSLIILFKRFFLQKTLIKVK